MGKHKGRNRKYVGSGTSACPGPAGDVARVRQEIVQEPEPRLSVLGSYANGDVNCKAMSGRISRSSCFVQNYRHPRQCAGCPIETGGA
jgi:hypothetical protein